MASASDWEQTARVFAEPTLHAGSRTHCYAQADGCNGEGLGSGAQDAFDEMIAQCTPRH